MRAKVNTGYFYIPTSDYVIVQMNNQVLIPVGRNNTLVELNIEDDMIVEGVEYLTLVLSSGDVAMIANGEDAVDTFGVSTTVFIEDNDGKFS